MDSAGELQFTAAEAAPLLGLASANSVYKYVHTGKLKPTGRRGGERTFAWADLCSARMTRRNRTGVALQGKTEDHPL